MKQFDNAMLFKRIVDHQSLTKAAHASGLNPPAVSKRLAKLERTLGTQLIHRTTRKLALTEAGQYFYDKVSALHHEWTSVIDETTSLATEIKGVLRIAAPQPLFSRFLMSRLTEFQQHYPLIRFELIHQQLDQLPIIDADICISREIPHYDSNTTVMMPFYTYRNGLFAAPSYLQQHPNIKQLSDLQQHNCLVYDSQRSPQVWEFDKQTVTLGNTTPTNSAEIMVSAACNGLGIVYLPKELLQEELAQQRLTPVLPTYCSRAYNTCAYYPKADFMPRKLRALLDFLKHQTPNHYEK